MKKSLWNTFVAVGLAGAIVASAPPALSASKKTPTPSPEASAAKTSSDKATKTEKVNLNTADEKDIAAAKGVGDKLAKELVKNRPYKTWEDVSKVKGVGTGKKLDSLKKVLKLSEGVAAKEEPAAKETKGKKTKSSSKGEETAAPAAAAAGGAAAGGASATTSKASSDSSTSKKSSSSSASSEKATAPKLAPGEKININTASAEDLDKLPEIGPVKAQAIVDYRKANGKFASIEDVMKVSGIKEGTFAKIKDYIVVR
jgi:competence protein ComEA